MSDQDLVGKFRVTLNAVERDSLLSLVKKGKVAARKIVRSRILLLSDEGEFGPGKSDVEIVSSLDCGVRTVERTRKKFVTQGLEKAICTKPQPPRPEKVKIKGDVEKQMLEIAKSSPPEGRSHWCVQMIADQMIAMSCVETIGRETVRVALKKRDCALGS